MMKRLLIMRHAQAVPAGQPAADWHRMLTDQGRASSESVGRTLKSKGILPQLILSSKAPRAVETATCLVSALGLEGENAIPIVQIEEFFTGSVDHFVGELGALPTDMHTVLVVAHNPWISDMVAILSGRAIDLAPGELALLVAKEDAPQDWASLVTETRAWRYETLD